MKPKKPSILKMVQNFAKESVKFIKQGAPVCSEEEYQERMSICMSCEHFTEKQTCGICGCRMPVKAGWKTSECPDTPKRWNKLVLTDKEKQLVEEADESAKTEHRKDLEKRIKDGERSEDTFKLHTAGWGEQEKMAERERLFEKAQRSAGTIEDQENRIKEKHNANTLSRLAYAEKQSLMKVEAAKMMKKKMKELEEERKKFKNDSKK